jgi:hypothetical protein
MPLPDRLAKTHWIILYWFRAGLSCGHFDDMVEVLDRIIRWIASLLEQGFPDTARVSNLGSEHWGSG